MSIKIRVKDEETSWKELVELLHEAFQEREKQGLNFSCSSLTPWTLKKQSEGSTILVAIDDEIGQLAGTVSLKIIDDKKNKSGYHYNLAVKPAYKNQGIASQLFVMLVSIAKESGCEYILSDTAVGAQSSVKWHIKNGFKIVDYDSSPITNYYSYFFRKQLVKNRFWSNSFLCHIHFAFYWILTRLYKREDGSLRWLGKAMISFKSLFMTEASLNDIQEYSLKVLLHVDEFCRAHEIPYTLAYGTLLGAVRHKGFIPWDDGVDLIMTRENFNQFVNIFQSDGEFLLLSPHDKNSFIASARVCDRVDTLAISRVPSCDYTIGVWVNIYPMDSVDDVSSIHRLRYDKLNREWSKLLALRGAKSPIAKQWGIRENVKILINKLLLLNGLGLRKRLSCYISEIQNEAYANSSHCAQLACCDEYGFYEKKDFEQYTTLDFEGHQLMAIKEYDKVLRLLYGDYMQLPPEKDRKPKQSHFIKFFHK